MPAFIGTGGSELLAGTGDNDRIRGLDGDDQLYGGAGSDRIWGGAGQDELLGEGGDDLLWGQSGDDVLLGLGDRDTLDGGAGDDILIGGRGDDTYHFAANWGNDRLSENAGEGFDVIRFGEGVRLSELTFTIEGDALVIRGPGGSLALNANLQHGSDPSGAPGHIERLIMADGSSVDLTRAASFLPPLLGSAADEELTGTFTADRIAGRGGDDTILAGAGADTAWGDLGHDRLFGEAGDDFLSGGAGDDVLAGDAGNDILRGGPGADVFDLHHSWAQSARERVLDFADGSDRLYLWGYSAGPGQDIDEPHEVLGRAIQMGDDTVITLPHLGFPDRTTVITLDGFARADLDASDLILHYPA